jgi:DNA-binding CsgD family transcriptional regulator
MRIAWKIVRWMRRKMGVRKRAELAHYTYTR